MQRPTEYFIRKDFWTGYYKLTPRVRTNPGQGIVAYLILLGIVIAIGSLIIMSLPFWLALFGLSVNRYYRLHLGIAVIMALGYFYLDIYNHWLSSYFFLGYIDDEGKVSQGLFGFGGLQFFHTVNLTSALVGLGYIIDSILYRQRNPNNNLNPWVIYGVALFAGLFIAKGATEFIYSNPTDYLLKVENNTSSLADENEISTQTVTMPNPESELSESLPIDTTITAVDTKLNKDNSDAEITAHTSAIRNYFDAVSGKTRFDARRYFADTVSHYISYLNITPDLIDETFKYDSKEYTCQKFFYDEDNIEFLKEVDGIRYYRFWMDFECYRTSKRKNQKSRIKVLYGLNAEQKISEFRNLEVESTTYY